jgi:hypothetical protein
MKISLYALCLVAAMNLGAQTKPLFSEDFESGQLDPKVWEQKVQGTASLRVQTEQTAHGRYALQVHYPEMAAQSFAFIVLPLKAAPGLPDSVKGHFFGRAYVRIDPATPQPHTVMVFAGNAGWPTSKFDEIGVYHDAFQPSYQENKSARGQGRGEDVRHAGPVPTGQWFLLEWEFNDDPSTLTIWADGQVSQVVQGDQKTDVSAFHWPKGSDMTKGLVGGFEEFGFGIRVWGAAIPTAFDVYYDDIAIDTHRIGGVR